MPTTPYAGLVSRAIALVVDALVVNVLAAIAGAAIGLLASLAGSGKPGVAAAVTGGALWLGWTGLYFAAFWTVTGQTPGSRLVGICVVSSGDRELGFIRACLRFVVMMLSLVPLGAGFLPILFDDRRRGLPDFAARTVVVWTSTMVGPVAEPVVLPRGPQPGEAPVPAPKPPMVASEPLRAVPEPPVSAAEPPTDEPPTAPLGGLPDA
jgi:uncharacterized RDD family membrane protein YckC